MAYGFADTREALTAALASFIPLLNVSSPQDAARLDLFRAQTLPAAKPIGKKEQKENAEIDKIMDSTLGVSLESMMVAEVPRINTRAGLYIYLNSIVSEIDGRGLGTWLMLFSSLEDQESRMRRFSTFCRIVTR